MVGPTVSAGYANALTDLAVSRGASRPTLLDRSGINPGDLLDQDNRIPFERFKALMRAAKALCDDPALALHFGETSLFTEMSIVGLISYASETMGEAFTQLNRYGRLVIEVDDGDSTDRFATVPSPDGAWLEDRRTNPNDFPELTESTLARFVCDCARLFPDTPLAKAVHVTHARPSHHAEYSRIFKAPVVFDSDRNALLIDSSWPYRKIGGSSRYVFGIFSERAAALLKSQENAKTAKGRVESMLIPILHTGETGMERVAKTMGLSRPTLYRQLKAEGVRYEILLDGLRHKMALHYLDGKKVSVSQTAYLVGFADPSAFSRAFKRWTGSSPGQRRES